MASTSESARDLGTRIRQNWSLFLRFAQRYNPAVTTLVVAVLFAWFVAEGVSDYTEGGWEIHVIERNLGLNIHFHHWYYGIPLGLLAFAIIRWSTTLSIFLFGVGQTLAAHSFINERGIPPLFEGGPTLAVPPEIYYPVVTAITLLYAFFLVRREEWLWRAKEREEISVSYLCPKSRTGEVVRCLDDWACKYLVNKKTHVDPHTRAEYGHWRGLDRDGTGEWELDYVVSPFDDQLDLLVVHLQHIPMQGRAGEIDERIQEMDAALKPLTHPAVSGPEAALKAFAELAP